MKKRIVLKLSGEVLKGEGDELFSPHVAIQLQKALLTLQKEGIDIAVVIGGGNLFRGRSLKPLGISPVTADYTGMLATVMNGLLLTDSFSKAGLETELLSSMEIAPLVKAFTERRAEKAFHAGKLLLLVGGTGNPFFTTDSAAALRAAEIKADAIVKATKVDGVYDKDPMKHKEAKRYPHLTFSEAIEQNLEVMDATAFAIARENRIPIIVCKMDDLLNGKLKTLDAIKQAGTTVEV